jgi:hypothetical protein
MNHKLIFTKLIFAAAILAACPLVLHAQAAPAPPPVAPAAPIAQPVTLRYKFVVGQVHRYQYETDMNMLMMTGQTGAGIPIHMIMQMTMRQTVKSIRHSDGAATLVSQIEAMHMLNNDKETPLPEAQQTQMKEPITQIMLPTGKILSVNMPALGESGMPGMDFSKGMFSGTPFLPAGPVKIDDSWSGTAQAAMAGMQMAFTSTLTSLDRKDGAALATIQNKQTGTIDSTLTKGVPVSMKMQGQITGDGTQLFDMTAGTLQSSTGTADTDMTMTFLPSADGALPPGMPQGMKMQMQMKYTMTRLSDTAPITLSQPAPPVQVVPLAQPVP